MKRVMLAIPSYDGKILVEFIDSFQLIIKELPEYEFYPAFLVGEAILVKARNELFQIAYTSNIDELVLIDSDIIWTVENMKKLLESPVDFVGGSYPLKDDSGIYVVKSFEKLKKDALYPLVSVYSLGCGFLRLSKKAIQRLWSTNKKYTTNGLTYSNVFETPLDQERGVIPEDMCLCNKWRALGGIVYLNTEISCSHVGMKKYKGSLMEYLTKSGLLEK